MDSNGWADGGKDYLDSGPVHAVGAAGRSLTIDALAAAYRLTGKWPRYASRPRVQFLYGHHVFDDEAKPFERMMASLSRDYSFISYSAGVRLLRDGNVDRPWATLSFDDGLSNMLTAGRILHRLGISACFFVCPAMIGETDRDKVAHWCRTSLLRPPSPVLGWADLETLLRQGHEVGSHTRTHANLGAVAPARAEDEIGQSRQTLMGRLGADTVRHFAWPYGLFSDMTPAAAATVYGAGFESCASALRGAHAAESAGNARPCLRRDHFVASWPIRRLKTLLLRNVPRMGQHVGAWPPGWADVVKSDL